MTATFIGLGSNISSAKSGLVSTLNDALEFLSKDYRVSVVCVSAFYETPAFPEGSGPNFANAAAKIEALCSPAEMMKILHEAEAHFGRDRAVRWGPRVLDLDLLGMDQAVVPDAETVRRLIALDPDQSAAPPPDELILPHPRLQDRAFVLVPLADIAPDWRHPVLGLTVVQMRDALPPEALAEVRIWNDD